MHHAHIVHPRDVGTCNTAPQRHHDSTKKPTSEIHAAKTRHQLEKRLV